MTILNYQDILEETKKSKKTKSVGTTTEKIDSDLAVLNHYVKQMEKFIAEFASKGKDNFTYDCTKLDYALFVQIARNFKMNNPFFYVEEHHGKQSIVVKWPGKNQR